MKGRPQNADAMAARNLDKILVRGYVNIMSGELALARGETAEAVRLFEDGVGILRLHQVGFFFWGSASLAQALGQQGEWLRALRVFEEAARQRKVVYHIANDSAGGGLAHAA